MFLVQFYFIAMWYKDVNDAESTSHTKYIGGVALILTTLYSATFGDWNIRRLMWNYPEMNATVFSDDTLKLAHVSALVSSGNIIWSQGMLT